MNREDDDVRAPDAAYMDNLMGNLSEPTYDDLLARYLAMEDVSEEQAEQMALFEIAEREGKRKRKREDDIINAHQQHVKQAESAQLERNKQWQIDYDENLRKKKQKALEPLMRRIVYTNPLLGRKFTEFAQNRQEILFLTQEEAIALEELLRGLKDEKKVDEIMKFIEYQEDEDEIEYPNEEEKGGRRKTSRRRNKRKTTSRNTKRKGKGKSKQSHSKRRRSTRRVH